MSYYFVLLLLIITVSCSPAEQHQGAGSQEKVPGREIPDLQQRLYDDGAPDGPWQKYPGGSGPDDISRRYPTLEPDKFRHEEDIKCE